MHSGGLRSEVDHGARLAAVGACWLLLALSAVGAIGITHFDDPNVGVILLLQCVPYAIATWLVVWGRPDRAASGRALATIVLVGVAMRCLLLPGTPVSNDLFRYVSDGRVQAAGINPYLHVPSDVALSGLRDGAIYPYINRADYAPTIYPPASQIVFYAPCILILIAEFALRRRRKAEEAHA